MAFNRFGKIEEVFKYFDVYGRKWISTSSYLGTTSSNYYSATSRIILSFVTDIRDGFIRTGYTKEIPSGEALML